MRKKQNVKRDECWEEVGRGKERHGKGAVLFLGLKGWNPYTILKMKLTIKLKLTIFSFTDVLEATFDSHKLKGNDGVNRYRYQVSLQVPRALAQCGYPKPPKVWHYHQPNPSLIHCRSSPSSYKPQFWNIITKILDTTSMSRIHNSCFKGHCPSKDTIKKLKVTDWEKTFASHLPDKGFISRIFKELLKLKKKKTNPI